MLIALEQAAAERWGTQEELLAALVDSVNALHTSYANAHRPEGTAPKEPPRITRPYERTPRKSWTDLALSMRRG